MYVEYEMSASDLQAMGRWVVRHSPYYRRSIPRFCIALLVCGFVGGSRFGVIEIVALSLAFVAFGLAVVAVVVPRSIASSYRTGRAVALTRPILVELSVEGVTQRDATGHTFVRWHALEAGGRTNDYVFLLANSLHTIVCPRRAFKSESEWNQFADFAMTSYERALGATA